MSPVDARENEESSRENEENVAEINNKTLMDMEKTPRQLKNRTKCDSKQRLILTTKDLNHISADAMKYINSIVEDKWMEMINCGGSLCPPFRIYKWEFKADVASITLADKKSSQTVTQIIEELGFLAWPEEKFLTAERAGRRKRTTLRGVLIGPAGYKNREALSRFLEIEKNGMDISGTLDLIGVTKDRNGDTILRLSADDPALGDLRKLDHELVFGASGIVGFEEEC